MLAKNNNFFYNLTMNYSNFFVFIASFIIAVLFFGAVMISTNIKSSRDELIQIQKDITALRDDLKRQEIEITSLTNPLDVVEFANDNEMKTISIDKIKIINIK